MMIEAPWLDANCTLQVMQIFAGAQGYFVGGCVRNALLDKPVSDLDIATDLPPQDVLKRAKALGLKALPTGLDHGTVTVIADGEPYEITTFRKDIETDGRHAKIAFSEDIKDDASRRDFTMNALYADQNGTIIDPMNGLPDLLEGAVRFIGDGNARIQEDYLRILRFFRFYAYYGNQDKGLDPESLAACAQNIDGLPQLSKERVGSEIIKILGSTDPATTIAAMEHAGVLNALLPQASSKYISILTHAELTIDPIARLSALMCSDDVPDLRLTNIQKKQFRLLRRYVSEPAPLYEIAYRHGKTLAEHTASVRAAMFEQAVTADQIEDIHLGSQAEFPIDAKHLMPEIQGKKLGETLDCLKRAWIESRFSETKSSLLAKLK